MNLKFKVGESKFVSTHICLLIVLTSWVVVRMKCVYAREVLIVNAQLTIIY